MTSPLVTLFLFTMQAAMPTAGLILTNAKIWTGDPSRPQAEAIAVVGDRVLAAGAIGEIDSLRGPKTRVVDAAGRRVVPGFNDSHLHFVMGGAQLDSVALKDAASPEEFSRRIGERARATPKGEWVLGGNWDDQRWSPPRLPAKDWIDAIAGDVPVFVGRYDGHMAVANSAALRMAAVGAKTEDPPGGTIVRDAHGEPTGLLKDAAMSLVYRVIPPMTREARLRAIRRALDHAARLGVTSVQDMGPDYADVALYAELAERGDLTSRISAASPIARWEDQAKLGLRRAFGAPLLRLGALKGFADGSLGSTTAYFFDAYDDAPSTQGLLAEDMQPVSKMRERVLKADAAGLQLCIHAIGDQAISMVLDIYAGAAAANGTRDRRFRIEHSQHMAAKDFDRYASLGVIASVQPYHAIDDGRWAERRIGPERAKRTYAFRTFLDRGVRLALGTDWPVAPLDPMATLYAAVTRATLDGKHPGGWVPEQKITLEEALRGYTATAAYAEFQDSIKGVLAPGKLADMVVLSEDIFAVEPARLREVRAEMTFVGGRQVYPMP